MSVINHNSPGIAGALNLDRSQQMLGRSLAGLSAGTRVITTSDDAAAVSISEKLALQNGRAKAASVNVQHAVSRAQTTDGMLDGMSRMLSRMSELATLSAAAAKNPASPAGAQQEFVGLQGQLRETIGGSTREIGGTADVASPLGTFNAVPLFGPSPTGHSVTIGQDSSHDVVVNDTNLRRGAMLGIIQQDAAGAYALAAGDPDAIPKLQDGIRQVKAERASLGEAQSRLELAATTLSVEVENLSSAMAKIPDGGAAVQATKFAGARMLEHSGTAMLSQANQTPKTVLQLLQG